MKYWLKFVLFLGIILMVFIIIFVCSYFLISANNNTNSANNNVTKSENRILVKINYFNKEDNNDIDDNFYLYSDGNIYTEDKNILVTLSDDDLKEIIDNIDGLSDYDEIPLETNVAIQKAISYTVYQSDNTTRNIEVACSDAAIKITNVLYKYNNDIYKLYSLFNDVEINKIVINKYKDEQIYNTIELNNTQISEIKDFIYSISELEPNASNCKIKYTVTINDTYVIKICKDALYELENPYTQIYLPEEMISFIESLS